MNAVLFSHRKLLRVRFKDTLPSLTSESVCDISSLPITFTEIEINSQITGGLP